MNDYKLGKALGIIEGVSWTVESQAVADTLQAAVAMIEEAVEENKYGSAT